MPRFSEKVRYITAFQIPEKKDMFIEGNHKLFQFLNTVFPNGWGFHESFDGIIVLKSNELSKHSLIKEKKDFYIIESGTWIYTHDEDESNFPRISNEVEFNRRYVKHVHTRHTLVK